jgi:hypothetical protein
MPGSTNKPERRDSEPGGRFLLVEERIPEFSYELFNNALSEGKPGLVFTRDYPAEIRSRYNLVGSFQMMWLTHLVGENNYNPTSLGLILSKITSFLDYNKHGVIMFDGIEYMISQNSFDRILHFIHQVRDLVILARGTMIMPFDTRILETKQTALLERNLEVIVPPEKPTAKRFTFELEDGLLKLLKTHER